MRAFEQLIEAIEYAQETDTTWEEQFNSYSEAQQVLKKAFRETNEEYDIARLAIALNLDPPDTVDEIENIKRACFIVIRTTSQ